MSKNRFLGVVYVLELLNETIVSGKKHTEHLVKIGMSAEPQKREMALRSSFYRNGSYKTKRLYTTIPHIEFKENERIMHDAFSAYRKGNTELFHISYDDVVNNLPVMQYSTDTSELEASRFESQAKTKIRIERMVKYFNGDFDLSTSEDRKPLREAVHFWAELTNQQKNHCYTQVTSHILVNSLCEIPKNKIQHLINFVNERIVAISKIKYSVSPKPSTVNRIDHLLNPDGDPKALDLAILLVKAAFLNGERIQMRRDNPYIDA